MMITMPPAPMLFLDFDGTVSRCDAVDLILEHCADERWLAIEEEWRSGLIGSRECLQCQMALVRATPRELNRLLSTIEVDEGLGALLATCAEQKVPVHIISDGFDYCIHRILARATTAPTIVEHLRHVRIYSSHLEPAGDSSWNVAFPYFKQSCTHGCATCKPAVMRLLNPLDAPTIFVGDGFSDRYAAGEAGLVFAKKSLARYCREQSIAHIAYESLADVATQLAAVVERLTYQTQDERTRLSA